ncbi:MAG: hypothetical protein U5M51_04130 [Emticicia sp.]|nr:hypothetical protein [Emticicia sp.]
MMGIAGFLPSFAQEESKGFFKKYPFVNITELGTLLGRNKYQAYGGFYGYDSFYPPPTQYLVEKRVNFSLQTFNGVYLNPKTAVGLTIGIDSYGPTVLTPISAGIRRNLVQKKQGGSILLGSLDVGYATTWYNEDNIGFKTTGGLVAVQQSVINFRCEMARRGLLNFGYRFQRAEYTQERCRFCLLERIKRSQKLPPNGY